MAGAGDEDNAEEFEALNDIEKVLQKIGISMRTTSAEFRNFDDVLADIAAKWVTLTDVERNAISTAFAGTRQREVFNVLMSNFDEVGKFENIAENSSGSTQQKMDIYGDSIEASKNRRTAAIEEFTQNFNILGADGEDILKTWNDLLAYIIKNAKQLIVMFGGLTVIIKGLVSGSMFGGLAKIMQGILVSASSFGYTMSTIGTNMLNHPLLGLPFKGLSKISTPIGNGITGAANWVKESKVGQAVSGGAKAINTYIAPTSVGQYFSRVRNDTVSQMRDMSVGRLYTAAYKAGVTGNMDAVQADKAANFISSLQKDPKQFEAFNKLSDESKQKVLNSLSQDNELQSGTEAHLTKIESYLQQIVSNTATDGVGNATDTSNMSDDDYRYAQLQSKYGTDADGNIMFPETGKGKKTMFRQRDIDADKKFADQYRKAKKAEIEASKGAAAADLGEQNASYQALTADEQEAYGSLKAAAVEQGMTGGDISRAGTLMKDKKVTAANQMASKFSGLGSSLAGVGSMAAMMGGSMLGQAAANKSGQEWTSFTGMGAGMLASAGISMGWNPAGWAMLAGAAVLGIATLIGGMIKTSKKIQEEAEEARSKLAEGANELKELASEIENLKKQSSGFNKLASGVDPETGENVSLTDDEFGQYQDSLKEIINARDKLYASYNKEGDLIAIRNGEIVKSNEIMEQAIELAKEEARIKARNSVNDETVDSSVIKSIDGWEDKIRSVNDQLNDKLGTTGISYNNIMSNVNSWQPPTNFGGDYGYTISRDDIKGNGKLYYSGMDTTQYGVEQQAGALPFKSGSAYNRDTMSVSFQDGLLVDETGYVIMDANGFAITQANAGDYLNLSDHNKNVSDTPEFKHLDEFLDIQNQYIDSGDAAQLLSNLIDLEASNDEKAAFLGISKDEYEEIINSPDILNKLDELIEQAKGFQIEIGKELQGRLKDVVDSIDGADELDTQLLSFLQNNVTGIQLSGLSKENLKNYKQTMADITRRIVGDKNLQNRLIDYDRETGIQEDADNNLDAYKAALGGVTDDGRVEDQVMRQMYNNVGFKFIDKDGNGFASHVVTNQEYLAYKLSTDTNKKNVLGYGTTDDWKNYTESELSTLYNNYDLVMEGKDVKGSSGKDRQDAIKRRIQEINMEQYSVQQLFGVLESDINRLAKKSNELWGGTLSEGVGKFNGKLKESSEAYNKLSQMAERLGVKSVEALAKMSKGLKLDQFGYSTQSMTEIKESFQQLQDIRNKLSSEGTMEAEDWDYLAENFSGVLAETTADDMIKAMDEALEAKEFQIKAEILGTFAENSELFKKFKAGLAEGINSESNVGKLLSGTTNFEQMQQIESALSLAGDNKNLQKQQLAKAFGIDPKENDWVELLDNTIKKNYGGMDYDSFMKTFTGFSGQISEVWTKYTDKLAYAQMQYQKALQDNEAFSNDLNKINTRYQQGALSADDYLSKLKALQNDSRASAEQLRELAESIEEVTFSQLNAQFEKGAISAKKYREEVTKLMSQNAIGSDDWNQQLQSYLSSFDSQIKLLSNDLEMLDDTDFAGMKRISNEKITISQQKLAAIEAAGIAQYGDSYDRETDPQWKAAQVELLQTYQAASQIIDQEKTYWQQQYERGYIGRDDLRQHLVDLSNETNITQEQFEQLNEQIEELDFGKLQELFEGGEMSGADYRKELSLLMKKQDMDSEQYKQYRKSFLGSFDQELGISEAKQALLGEHDYFNRDAFLGEDINILKAQAAALEAAGLEESEQYYTTIGKIVDKEKERVELKKEQLEYEISLAEEVMDAYTNILNYGMEELQNRQKDINDMYDDEISKLQDINDQKKRSIELTKLQQELENAKKEKTRVYQAGVGFVYQENKAKVKEAKQNLENYLDERKIQDLQFAQKQQNKLIQDQIDRLQDISDYISEIKSTATATASVMDLIKNGVVPPGTTIDQAIKQINNEAINGEDGKIASLGVKFDGFASDYTTKSELLNGYIDELESKLAKISDTYMTYENDKALVEGFSSQLWSDYNTEVKPDRQTFEQTIQDFINGKGTGYTKWKDDITKAFSDNKPVVNVSSGNNVDLSEIERQIRDANLYLKGTALNKKLTTGIKYNKDNFVDKMGYLIRDYLTHDERYFVIQGKYFKTSDVVQGNGYLQSGTQYYTEEDLRSLGHEAGWFGGGVPELDRQNAPDESKINYAASPEYRYPDGPQYSYSDGIENGPVTYTGLAMLHGSPSSPEYVLNSDQAGTLLKNLATMTMSPYQAPKVDSYNRGEGSTVYQFTGDLNLPNVQRPDQFFNELLKQANVQFPTIKRNYL